MQKATLPSPAREMCGKSVRVRERAKKQSSGNMAKDSSKDKTPELDPVGLQQSVLQQSDGARVKGYESRRLRGIECHVHSLLSFWTPSNYIQSELALNPPPHASRRRDRSQEAKRYFTAGGDFCQLLSKLHRWHPTKAKKCVKLLIASPAAKPSPVRLLLRLPRFNSCYRLANGQEPSRSGGWQCRRSLAGDWRGWCVLEPELLIQPFHSRFSSFMHCLQGQRANDGVLASAHSTNIYAFKTILEVDPNAQSGIPAINL